MNKKTGVFLTGGGGKGSFEIGFFKALEELGIKPDVICGSSAGAVVGAGATYMNSKELFECWKNLTLESVFNVDSNKLKDIEGTKRILRLWKEVIDSCLNEEFLIDISNIRELVYSLLDEEKIRNSKIEYGLTTTVLPDFKMVKVFKDEMQEGLLLEYVIASLYLPLFRNEKIINNKHYLDIAAFQKYPFEMLKEKGCNEIYIVDIVDLPVIKSILTAKKVFDENTKVHIINMENQVSILDFSSEQAIKNYNNGYETTIKTLIKK